MMQHEGGEREKRGKRSQDWGKVAPAIGILSAP